MAFVITALASQEFLEKLRAYIEPMISKIASVEQQAAVALADKATLERKIHELEEKLTSSSDLIRSTTEKAEMWERLVQLSRAETQAQIEVREKIEQKMRQEQIQLKMTAQSKEELEKALAEQLKKSSQNDELENQLKIAAQNKKELETALALSAQNKVEFEKALSQTKQTATQLSALQENLEKEAMQRKEGEEKIHLLTDQLGQLTDRLKELQSEKEKLEKALDEALKPELEEENTSSLSFSQLQGLYNQLREQFEEKKALLDSTRKDLFHVQEELSRLQKIRQDLFEFDSSGIIAGYEKHIAALQFALQAKEEEVALYEQLVTALSRV
jgi:hypothetical protein